MGFNGASSLSYERGSLSTKRAKPQLCMSIFLLPGVSRGIRSPSTHSGRHFIGGLVSSNSKNQLEFM